MGQFPAHLKRFAFKNRQDAHDRAKKYHVCLGCLHNQPETYKICPKCGSKDRHYFPSEVEFKRGQTLLMMRDMQRIHTLHFHPRYSLVVEGDHITIYEADASYIITETDRLVVEDSKFAGDPKYIEPLSLVKMRLFEALSLQIFGKRVKVTIPQQLATKTAHKETLI